ncbi:hypothetical protein BJ508DRAFT_365336 [Ascobolus immersus RN42]|uniref:DUF7918 domain-containing protein n=1 Tax=Ascobolus immersus RN42 TaxID=1160509 RepID=A0A3N4HQD7_ASCIM|nr:hypothetical protein BJ508DRAFT_365336 [Ascobolus immersus RN42]
MVQFSGFTFSVETEKGRLPEYAFPKEEPENTKTVYIEIPEADQPQTFRVRITPTVPLNFNKTLGWSFQLCLDGIVSSLWRIISRDKSPGGLLLEGLDVPNVFDPSSFDTKEMYFRPLEMTEDEEYACNVEGDHIGIIGIAIAERGRCKGWDGGALESQAHLLKGMVHEKKMKGSSATHSTKLGKQLLESQKPIGRFKLLEPVVYLRFLYRDKRRLQNLGVLPETNATPQNLKTESDSDDEAPSFGMAWNSNRQEPKRAPVFIDLTTDDWE